MRFETRCGRLGDCGTEKVSGISTCHRTDCVGAASVARRRCCHCSSVTRIAQVDVIIGASSATSRETSIEKSIIRDNGS
jgi:hypothetical protein